MSTMVKGEAPTYAFATSALHSHPPEVRDDGTALFTGVPVFRSGTFKDSMGDQRTWTDQHLLEMVSNFTYLQDRSILADVPVRDGHKGFFGGGGDVIGYVQKIYQEDGRLLADFEITEPDHVGKIERGTHRARSSEIGMFESNDEEIFWPVFQGFAFVDIPAVEGLFAKKNDDTTDDTISVWVDQEEDTPMGDESKHSKNNEATPPAPETKADPDPAPPSPEGEQEQDDKEKGGAEFGKGESFTFKVNGDPTTDFAAVQTHILTLEETVSEFNKNARKEFVEGLAGDNKISAKQVDQLTAFAQSLTPEQYSDFVDSYEHAPVQPLFARHGGGSSDDGGEQSDHEKEVEIARGVVENLRKSGLTEEKVQESNAYKRLQTLTQKEQ